MLTAKYVIGVEMSDIRIFPLNVAHCDVMPIDQIKNAGFVDFIPHHNGIQINCYGESDSTGKKSGENDSHLLKIFLKKR